MMRKISIILCLLLSAALAVAVFKIVQTINIQQKEKEDFQIIADLVETPPNLDETSSTTVTQDNKEETKQLCGDIVNSKNPDDLFNEVNRLYHSYNMRKKD